MCIDSKAQTKPKKLTIYKDFHFSPVLQIKKLVGLNAITIKIVFFPEKKIHHFLG